MGADMHAIAHETAAVEDYAAAIHELQHGREPVRTGQIAARLGVTPGAVSGMIARLGRLGLAQHDRYHGVRLTAEGERVAHDLIRRHALLERWMIDQLGLPPDRARQQAASLAHYLSPTVEAAIAGRCAAGAAPRRTS